MKNIKHTVFAAVCLLAFSACGDFLDVIPKGKNTLSTLDDLETLLNDEYINSWGGFTKNLFIITNEQYPYKDNNTPAYFVNQGEGLTYGYVTYDENVDRAALTESDDFYTMTYQKITRYNTLLAKIGDVLGEQGRKERLIAESKTLRAYMHWMLVNVFAKTYTTSSAATDGGIPYVKDVDFDDKNKKLTVAQVYDNILADLSDENIGKLPETAKNFQRVSRAFAYAVRAKVHLSMHNYGDALADAGKALGYNNALEDRRPFIDGTPTRVRDAADNYIYMPGTSRYPIWNVVSAEWISLYEPGDIMFHHTDLYEDASTAMQVPGCYTWKNGAGYEFNALGIKTEDMTLVKAECQARGNDVTGAMKTLNDLRKLRIHPDAYTDLTAANTAEAMSHVIKVSKTEYLFTYNNFFNIKRWNTEEAYRQTITRTIPIGGTDRKFTLRHDSPYWVMPFPNNAVQGNPSLTQNF